MPASALSQLLPALTATALILIACDPGANQPPAAQSPLHRCIGEASYSDLDWDKLKADLKANPIPCNPATTPAMVASVVAPAQSVGDSLRYHTVVMDSRCRPVAEYRDSLRVPAGTMSPMRLWTGTDAEGRSLPTGEYYVNTEMEWMGGAKDTSYLKMGYVNTSCPG